MAMSRKHFEGIAQAISDARNASKPDIRQAQSYQEQQACVNEGIKVDRVFDSMSRDVANVCATQSPKFDRERFLLACGVQV